MISEAQARVLEWLDAIDQFGFMAFLLAGDEIRKSLLRKGFLLGGLNGPSITPAGRKALAEWKEKQG